MSLWRNGIHGPFVRGMFLCPSGALVVYRPGPSSPANSSASNKARNPFGFSQRQQVSTSVPVSPRHCATRAVENPQCCRVGQNFPLNTRGDIQDQVFFAIHHQNATTPLWSRFFLRTVASQRPHRHHLGGWLRSVNRARLVTLLFVPSPMKIQRLPSVVVLFVLDWGLCLFVLFRVSVPMFVLWLIWIIPCGLHRYFQCF